MKPLLPTLKERKRYIVYEMITATPAGATESLLTQLNQTLGVFGAARAGILSISYDPKSQTGILRVRHDQLETVRAAMSMVTHVGRQQVLIRVLGVSGILAKSKRFLPEGAQHKLGTR